MYVCILFYEFWMWIVSIKTLLSSELKHIQVWKNTDITT